MTGKVYPSVFYFETSAVNFLYRNWTIGDAIATKAFQEVRGRTWKLSPVTLFEILLTTDEEERERVIYFCQHLFARELLPSPEELIVEFIRAGSPVQEEERKLVSQSELAATWRYLVDNKDLTLVYEIESFVRLRDVLTTISKQVRSVMKRKGTLVHPNEQLASLDTTLSSIVNSLSFVRLGEPISNHEVDIYKLSVAYILYILCSELTLDPRPVSQLWQSLKVSDDIQFRMRYTLQHHEELIHRGPFVIMAIMTMLQAARPFSRGVYLDCLHATYLPYVDIIVTQDEHFRWLREEMHQHITSAKIVHVDELEFVYESRENPSTPDTRNNDS